LYIWHHADNGGAKNIKVKMNARMDINPSLHGDQRFVIEFLMDVKQTIDRHLGHFAVVCHQSVRFNFDIGCLRVDSRR
jgi:hypothetical protein